ncbi:hypothetical protein M2337_002329 [Sphingobium sp. B2D3A]|nr:hypothetical protein [Sphingobium sp. B2D3A]MCW2361690.1 hypothetical protein [Sphingobium sp. B10D3B]MCW2384555.1 hypothetical protein [Sphingobium sp. B2D3D]MCW2401631.1 hypothetical protein [Sphingobium sp. B10D7B]MCW2408611.1 hypothetical protein [Sphingobium xanthum]
MLRCHPGRVHRGLEVLVLRMGALPVSVLPVETLNTTQPTYV